MRPSVPALSLAPFLFVVAAAALPGRARPVEPETMQIASTSWSEGDRVQDDYESRSILHTVVFDQGNLVTEFDSIEERHAVKTITILAADAVGPTRMRIEYGTLRSVQQRLDAPTTGRATPDVDEIDERSPLQHRAFVLERQASGYRVLDDAGRRLAEGVARLVLEEEGLAAGPWMRAGDRVARELAGRTLTLGTEVTLSKEAAVAFFDSRESLSQARLVVTPKADCDDGGRRVHVLALKLSVIEAGGSGRPQSSIELSGDLRLDALTGRFLDLKLDGTLVLDSAAKDDAHAIEISGQGPWTIRETSHDLRPR